jgi:hypothetical protein
MFTTLICSLPQVLVFLDSHVEVNKEWLQPLLARIAAEPHSLVTPVIDIINADTFQYTSSPLVRGGFNWGLHFKWENVPEGQLQTDADFIKPIRYLHINTSSVLLLHSVASKRTFPFVWCCLNTMLHWLKVN